MNTSKISKRRLKKTARRTFGGLLLASSIIVAAIPVPEARAYDPASAAIPPYNVTTTDYTYSYPDLDYPSDTDFKTKTPGSVQQALILSKTSIGSWQLDWQYKYWNQTSGSNGYITEYNNQYSVEDIALESRVFSDYVYLTQSDVENYYQDSTNPTISVTIHYGDGGTPTVVSGIETVNYEYKIADAYDNTRPADSWLMKNFPDDTIAYRDAYLEFLADPTKTQPEPLVRTLGDKYKTDTERVQHLCEKVFGDGTPAMSLVNVDKRVYDSSGIAQTWEKVYVPNIGSRPSTGTITIGGHAYYVDMNFFLCDTFATIVGVGKDAFKDVSNVKNLTMAKEISFIGDSAFENSFLGTVSLSSDAKIGNRAFYGCTKLSQADLPEGIRRIGAEAFYGCPLKDIVIPDSCTYIGPGAFADSSALSTVTFANGGSSNPKTIAKFAFYDDIALNSVSFGESHITELGDAVFAVNNNETGNMSDFTFPNYITKDSSNVTNIGDYCLAGRDNLRTVTFPPNTDGNLRDTIFYLCTGLDSVVFSPECYNMTYTSTGNAAGDNHNTMFYTVANPNFYVRGPKLNSGGTAASPRTSTWVALYDYAATGNVGRHVPYVYTEGGKDYYEVSDGNYLMVIEKDTGELISCTFPPSSTPAPIDRFTIPAVVGTTQVSGLKDGCFEGDTLNVGVLDYIVNLVVEDGSSISSIDDNTFKDADRMETAYLGDSVTSIGKAAFEDCPKLEQVTIGENITSIGDEAFQNDPKLEKIIFETPSDLSAFPEGSIGTNAFNTQGTKLTLEGEIGVGYAPFEWATDTANYANKSQSIRALYKTPLPTGLSVILDNRNELTTLVDYPHYEYLDRIAYDAANDKLLQFDAAPSASDPYYGQTIMDKIASATPLNYWEETMVKNCSNIVIPEGIESIDSQGFFNDTSLNPNGVDSYSNSSSKTAYFGSATTLPYSSYSGNGLFNGYYGDGTIIDTSDGMIREYANGESAEEKAKGNDRITSVSMKDVVYLPDNAFDSCENLETVSLGTGIRDAGSLPFSGCEKISSIACGNDNFVCNNGILYQNNSDGTKTLVECLESRGKVVGTPTVSTNNDPDLANVKEIEDKAFANCDTINSVDLTGVSKLEKIPDECFSGCENMTEIDIPANVGEIGDKAFDHTGDYTKVTVRNKNLYLGDDSNGVSGDKVKTSYYVTYMDAPSRKTAEKQKYIIDQTLDDVWTVKFYDDTGTIFLYSEQVEDGDNAEGPDEALIPVKEGYTFSGWNKSLKNITSDDFILATYTAAGTTTPGAGTNTTPGAGSTTPGAGTSTTPGAGTSTTPGSSSLNPTQQAQANATSAASSTGKKYKLTVNYGSGSGDYPADTTVIIEAIDPPAGKVFDKWSVAGNSTPNIYSATSKSTTLKMPASDVIVTALYKDSGSAGSSYRSSTGTSGGNGNTGQGNNGTYVNITKPGISNVDKAYASVSGSSDNFIVKISESDEAANLVATALSNKYGDMTGIKYFAMDISLYDSTGTTKITGTNGLAVTVTMPIPDAMIQYAGNNRVGAVNGTTLEDLNCKFVTVGGIPCISFTATHFSPYTIYVDTNNLTYGTIDSTPKTGDGIHPKWFASISLFAVSMILFFKRDKTGKKIKTA
ncbi:MAG: leucine-rich repeat protein [Lachnospiraceae bacterium]|nr:leucine-rich repeat protein [Lachnospiraceae bacterium]